MLEKFDVIRPENYNNVTIYVDFYSNKKHDKVYYILNKKKMDVIISKILDCNGISFNELLEDLKVPRTTLLRKTRELIEEGILVVESSGEEGGNLKISSELENLVRRFLESSKDL